MFLPNAGDLMQVEQLDKDGLRRTMKAYRAALAPADVARWSAAACRRLLRWLAPRARGATLCAYAALPQGELDVSEAREALRREGARTLLPRVADATRGAPLELIEIGAGAVLQPRGPLQIPEPIEGAVVPASEVDLFLMPALAFDAAGHRLGFGRGHFDATVRLAPRATRVVLGYEGQLVDACPYDAFDEPVDLIVTESRLVTTGARPRHALAGGGLS